MLIAIKFVTIVFLSYILSKWLQKKRNRLKVLLECSSFFTSVFCSPSSHVYIVFIRRISIGMENWWLSMNLHQLAIFLLHSSPFLTFFIWQSSLQFPMYSTFSLSRHLRVIEFQKDSYRICFFLFISLMTYVVMTFITIDDDNVLHLFYPFVPFQ